MMMLGSVSQRRVGKKLIEPALHLGMESRGSDKFRILHRLQLVDSATGEPISTVEASLAEPGWAHWVLVQKGADILLAAKDTFAASEPDNTDLIIRFPGPDAAVIYGAVHWVPGQPAPKRQVRVVKGPSITDDNPAPLTKVAIEPRKNDLIVKLRDQDGAPLVGAAVTVHPRSTPIVMPDEEDTDTPAPPPVPLAKAAGDANGVYRSGPRHWPLKFRPARVFLAHGTENVRFLGTVLIDRRKGETFVELQVPVT